MNIKPSGQQVRITTQNIAEWPDFQGLLNSGKILFDTQGRLRYLHGAPVGDLICVGANKDGAPKFKESTQEWFDPDSALAKRFEWPK